MDVYVVLDGAELVGVSARLQGAELLRSEWANNVATRQCLPPGQDPDRGKWTRLRDQIYARQQIVNTELQDAE